MSDALVPPEARALVGTVTTEPVTVVVTAREAQRYAQAVDDLNPVYFDEAAAVAAGYRTLVAPPTFVDHAVVEGRPWPPCAPTGCSATRTARRCR